MPHADVIVIGSGAMGAAAAAALAGRGAAVLALDRFGVPHDRGSSHGATRLIRRAYFEHPDYVPLLHEAYRGWRDLEAASGTRLLVPCGLLLGGLPGSEAVAGALHAAALHRLDVERLPAVEAAARWPEIRLDDDWIAVWEPGAGYLLVEECIRAFAALARRRGARLEAGVTVQAWRAGPDGVAVETDRGTFHADRLVITPGAWAEHLVRLPRIPFRVLRKSLFWYRPPPAAAAAFSAGRLPCFAFDTPAGFHYGFPALDADGVKIAEHSGGATVADPLSVDRGLDAAEEAGVAAVARARLPRLGHDLVRHAACLYTMTPDAHFVIGLHPDAPRVAVAAGFSGHGFKFASAVGPILADLALEGRSHAPIGFLAPGRFDAAADRRPCG
ncbi:MAG: N-methyl-L-tryptophan oxidase [Planctomycetaceae bacterium]